MKLKKTLSSILATSMILGTMTTSVLANEMPELPFGDENQRTASIMLLSNDEQSTGSNSADNSWYKEEQTEFTLTTAKELKGFAALVDGGKTFEGKTVKLGNDIDLDSKLFNPIGSYRNETAFKGTFDGQENSIKNLSQNTWELDTGYYYSDLGLGLFGLVENATIKNLKIDGANISGESAICGTVAATAYGNCVFENITVSNANVADYQYYAGGVVGWASGDHKYINCVVADTTTIGSQWGDFGNASGGVIGGTGSSAKIYMKDCSVACRIDAVNDVVSAYQWYAYRNCGMLIGRTNHTATDDAVTNASAPHLTCENVSVTYGDWANYTYCEFAGTGYPYVRVQPGTSVDAYTNVRYGHPTDAAGNTVVNDDHVHNDGEDHHKLIVFNQLYGGPADHRYCTYGVATHEGVNIIDNAKVARSVAIVNDEYKETLQDAIDATNGNGTVTLLKDVNESGVIKGSELATYSNEGVTIDLDGFTITGNIVVEEGAVANLTNGKIVNEDSAVSAIATKGTTTLTNVDVTSERHAVRVEGGTTTINGGTYKVVVPDPYEKKTLHAVNVSDGGNVIIEAGTFIGPKGTELDSGSAVNIQANSTGVIYGGKFSGGKLNTLSCKGTLIVYGGLFDQDPTAYAAEGYEAVETGETTYLYSVEPLDAQGVKVEFVPTEEKNVYNIVLKSTSYQNIYEFVSAEFKFINDSKTVGGKEMDYEILGYNGLTVVEQSAQDYFNNDQYLIRIPRGEIEHRLTGREITIGQVKFIGQATTQFQGDIKFDIESGEVDATERKTNLGYYYTTTAETLTVVKAEDSEYAIDSEVSEIKRDVIVNVAFNHNIDTADYWEGYQITATLKNNFGYNKTQSINIADVKSGNTIFEDVPLGQISVTLTAPGFRTYTYKTVVEETTDNGELVLNFWNDVKRENQEVIEDDKNEMYHNFLVGDIVMDYTVDKYDLAAVTSYYGTYNIAQTAAEKYIKYDLNRDGDIDIRDVQYVLHTMGN